MKSNHIKMPDYKELMILASFNALNSADFSKIKLDKFETDSIDNILDPAINAVTDVFSETFRNELSKLAYRELNSRLPR